MIVLTRDLARRYRAVARRCIPGRPRGPAPPVICRTAGGVLTLTARLGDVTLGVSAPAPPAPDETLVVPMAVFEAAGGGGSDPVEVRSLTGSKGEARWTDRGVPRTLAFDTLDPGGRHEPPPRPAEWVPVPHGFLTALDECGRTAARESGRFALDRVQVRGKVGQVIGTDGRTAVIAGGFALPFADDLLVPAVPAFGCRELTGETNIRVGRADGQLVVRAGPWTIWIRADPGGRYPDVAAVVPRSADPPVVVLAEADARAVLDALPALPGADQAGGPVTLDLNGTAVVRAGAAGDVAEVRLAASTVAGPPCRVAIDRAVVGRALRLGCRTVRLSGAGKPVVFTSADWTVVAVPLDPAVIVAPDPATPAALVVPPAPIPDPTVPRRTELMKPPETNGHPRPDPPPADPVDPLAEAESLRAGLVEAAHRAGRLVAALKHRQKERKALTQAWSSLQSLNLGSRGGP